MATLYPPTAYVMTGSYVTLTVPVTLTVMFIPVSADNRDYQQGRIDAPAIVPFVAPITMP